MAFDESITPSRLLQICSKQLHVVVDELGELGAAEGTAVLMGDGLGFYNYVNLPPDLGGGRADIKSREIMTMLCHACNHEGRGVLTILDREIGGRLLHSFGCCRCEQFMWFTERKDEQC